jgi:SAM-dependent methyltransferase
MPNDIIQPEPGMSCAEIETMRAVEDDLWWYRALRHRVVEAIRPPRASFDLLDAGCGTGGMLTRVRERFPEASLSGIDFSERAVELTRRRNLGATLVQGTVDALPFADASFDVVLSLDVLIVGGVNAPVAAREMDRVLRPDGMLIVNLPAFDFLRGSHDVAVNIARRYNRPRLEALLRGAGFQMERWSYWNMSLLPAIAAVRWATRGRGGEKEVKSDLKPMFPPLNRALTALAMIELAVSRAVPLPFGTSLFAIARK